MAPSRRSWNRISDYQQKKRQPPAPPCNDGAFYARDAWYRENGLHGSGRQSVGRRAYEQQVRDQAERMQVITHWYRRHRPNVFRNMTSHPLANRQKQKPANLSQWPPASTQLRGTAVSTDKSQAGSVQPSTNTRSESLPSTSGSSQSERSVRVLRCKLPEAPVNVHLRNSSLQQMLDERLFQIKLKKSSESKVVTCTPALTRHFADLAAKAGRCSSNLSEAIVWKKLQDQGTCQTLNLDQLTDKEAVWFISSFLLKQLAKSSSPSSVSLMITITMGQRDSESLPEVEPAVQKYLREHSFSYTVTRSGTLCVTLKK